MSDDYAPEAGGAREDFTYPWEGLNPGRRGRLAAFVRWMVEHDRQVAERAWEKGAIAGHRAAVLPEPLAPNPYQAIVEAATGPTPGGLPGLTDAEAEAFLAAIDKSDTNAEEADRADH